MMIDISAQETKVQLANRLFLKLYQCAKMLHRTGTRVVEAEALTTQQWAVLEALSREQVQGGMSIGDLARYLMVTRQNLSGLVGRMERDGQKGQVLTLDSAPMDRSPSEPPE